MRTPLNLYTALTLLTSTIPPTMAAMPSSTTIHQFPLPTWLENIAVRPNGHLLVTLLTTPELHLIDPTAKTTTLIHTFAKDTSTNITGLLGLAELAPDNFAFVAGHIPQTATPGTYSIWSADFRGGSSSAAVVQKLADVPGGQLLNGLAPLNAHTLLIADSMAGVLWTLDTRTRASSVALDHASLKPGRDAAGAFVKAGVNGLRVRAGFAYYSNSATGALSRVAVDCATGRVTGKVETLATGLLDADDFAFGKGGSAVFVARNTGGVVEVREGGVVEGLDVGGVLGATSAAFGRTRGDGDVLYVSTIGRVNGTFVEGGKVVAIKL
ncbi:hypothetical protein K505DRAFT_313468 [Melanomma pulvis-pyrius CBS 109.77]|uniref:Uncharacterized protein n=1 Tax=Melanomma pulvis-pyrius CBS 109.77 TaxID=1314802 RepID=A0A6A6WZ85_9PLEO|nr:hypothetical protein K505DRAFT_313468 [Melanomma pulvis-pyrius CBS 109.77]